MNTITVNILTKNGVDNARLEINRDAVAFNYKDIDIVVEDSIPFLALKKMRKKLENYGILLAVEGCRRDVYPSGMQLDMKTPSAYIHEMGKTSGLVINIFEPSTSFELLASIEEQEEYHKRWIESIK